MNVQAVPSSRQIVLQAITAQGDFIWTCSCCCWRYPLIGQEQESPLDALQVFGNHTCAAYPARAKAAA